MTDRTVMLMYFKDKISEEIVNCDLSSLEDGSIQTIPTSALKDLLDKFKIFFKCSKDTFFFPANYNHLMYKCTYDGTIIIMTEYKNK